MSPFNVAQDGEIVNNTEENNANFEIKKDSQNIDQTKIKKSWCDHHKYNKSHATQNCYFLNKKNRKTKEIKQAEATDDDVFHSADDRSETEGQ